MILTSNVPDTQFRCRMQRIDAAPEEGWQVLGRGREFEAALYEGGRYEISAQADGYIEKRVKLTEPIARYAFQFLQADRLTSQGSGIRPPAPKTAEVLEPNVAGPGRIVRKATAEVGKKWAVVIGISSYQQRGKWGLADLRYASRDAAVVADYLGSPNGGRFDHVKVLVDGSATVQDIKEALREELRGVQANDMVLVYWAGHGMSDPHEPDMLYLLGHDSDPAHMASTAYAMDEFRRDIRSLKANRIIVFADACHSAGLSDPSTVVRGDVENKIIDGLRGVTIGPGPGVSAPSAGQCNLIFTSCEAGEQSLESAELDEGHGIFTYFLLEGLNGAADRRDNNGDADGRISLGEVIDYTIDKVKRFSQNRQHPDTAGRFDRELVIGAPK
jgi:uncharacterized caspase-like protein